MKWSVIDSTAAILGGSFQLRQWQLNYRKDRISFGVRQQQQQQQEQQQQQQRQRKSAINGWMDERWKRKAERMAQRIRNPWQRIQANADDIEPCSR